MTDPTIGITFARKADEPISVIASDMSTIAIVGTAEDADTATFPLDTPILLRTSDATKRTALGETGTIPDAVRGIADQLTDFQAGMDVIIVRVAEGADDLETMANIIGNEADGEGIYALLMAGPDLARIPRLVVTPGFNHQVISGLVKSGALVGGNTGTNGTFALAFTGGTGSGAAGTFTVAGGSVTSVTITDPGNYTVAPELSFAASANLVGASQGVALADASNGVNAALPGVLSRLMAHAIVEGPGTTEEEILDWRETINDQRLIPIDMWVKVLNGTSVDTAPGAARFAGMIAAVDYEHGGRPMHSAANRPMQGIVGMVRNPSFSLTDGATEAQNLLAAGVGVLVRGELGVESAISSSGYIALATDTATDEPLWQFYNVSRGRDYIHLGLLRSLRTYLGRFNISGHTIQAVLNTATLWFEELKANDAILDFRVSFAEDQNTPEALRLGKFSFTFQAEEPAPLRRLHIDSARLRPALEGLIQDLLQQTSPSNPIAA